MQPQQQRANDDRQRNEVEQEHPDDTRGAPPNGYIAVGTDDLRAGTYSDPDADDVSVRATVADPGSYQSNHGTTGMGGDDERSDPDDAKVTGQSRDS